MHSKTHLTLLAEQVRVGTKTMDELMDSWSQRVHLSRWSTTKTPRHDDGQDLTQEIFLEILEHFPEFDASRSNFETWAFLRARAALRRWYRFYSRSWMIAQPTPNEQKQFGIVSYDDSMSIAVDPVYPETGAGFVVGNIKLVLKTKCLRPEIVNRTGDVLDLLLQGRNRREIAGSLGVTYNQVLFCVTQVREVFEEALYV